MENLYKPIKQKDKVKLDEIVWSKRCYGYVRVSTKKQEDEGMSLETQERKIRAWAEISDHKVVDIYRESGTGKSLEKRPEFIKLFNIIKKGETLVVLAFSRLARSTRDFLAIMDNLIARGCRIVVMTEGLDTITPYGAFVATMFSAVAQLEATMISDRVKDNMKAKKEKGEFVGRVPYGWKLSDGAQSDLVEVPEEQAIIKRMREMREQKDEKGKVMSYEKIAKKLNEEGIKPRYNPKNVSQKWSHTSVLRIINRTEVVTKGRDPSERTKNKKKTEKEESSSDKQKAEETNKND